MTRTKQTPAVTRVLGLLAILLAGLAAGAVSAAWSFGALGGAGLVGATIGDGAWRGDLAIGSRDADPYTRAVIARRGLLALSREETIYFSRETDDRGERLREDCTYRMEGGDLPARWWSVTLYAADDYLAHNPHAAHSISRDSVSRDAISRDPGGEGAGAWSCRIGGAPTRAEPWVSTQAAGDFSLTLRLYNPHPEALAHPSQIDFPSITRLSCEEAGS